jgi:presequence protease
MALSSEQNRTAFKQGDRIGGYQIDGVSELTGIDATLVHLVHGPTGARHIHIQNQDKENTFAVVFKTVPADSTGVAHILEHTVLCGSRRYPVRDPFFSMIKRSLNTFMNAFTASDWTMYPFSTQNRKDFYNLMDVYLDAVFFPNIDALSFQQEGHRLDIEADETLVFKGVVYNEMKGAMSSPNQVMARSLLNALYPDTTYHFNSGGEPADIPGLTHEQLRAFHARHYHPSNAYFYTYGSLDLATHLALIEEKVLAGYTSMDPGTAVPSQPRWDAPREVAYPYALAPTEDGEKKYQACLAWLTADIQDTFAVLALTLLEQVLLGNAAAPLRKSLIDSDLGSTLSDGSGLDGENRDTLFAVGLKDVAGNAAADIERLIFSTLGELVDNGIDRELIDSAIHQLEFHRKEVTNTPYPYGLRLLLGFCATWLHGGDPVRVLSLDADLERIREAVDQGPFFENLIRQWFLDNPHRVRLVLTPDPDLARREEAREQAALDRIGNHLDSGDREQIRQMAASLKQRQETGEDLSCLPTLSREDIPVSVPSVAPVSCDVPASVTCFDQPTSGIFYFSAAAGAGALGPALIPLVPFFCYAFTKMGTRRRDYAAMARRIDAYTGGVGMSAHARTRFDDDGECLPFISFNGKCLVRNQQQMFDILQELMDCHDFSNLDRLKSLLRQYRAGLEAMVLQNGHRLAILLASRNFSTASLLAETWSGVHQLRAIKALTDPLSDAVLADTAGNLAAIARQLLCRDNLRMAVIGDGTALGGAAPLVDAMVQSLDGNGRDGFAPPPLVPETETVREGWGTASAVSFVAAAFPVVRLNHDDAPALAVIAKILKSLFLHREIREKGGAYGGFSLYNPEDGLFAYGSYRDPHIVSTLNVYQASIDFIQSGRYDEADVAEAILQVCSEIDKPDPPGPAARKAFYRAIIGLSDDDRHRFKERLLAVDHRQVQAVARRHFVRDMATAVISGDEQLARANQRLGAAPLAIRRI